MKEEKKTPAAAKAAPANQMLHFNYPPEFAQKYASDMVAYFAERKDEKNLKMAQDVKQLVDLGIQRLKPVMSAPQPAQPAKGAKTAPSKPEFKMKPKAAKR